MLFDVCFSVAMEEGDPDNDTEDKSKGCYL